MYGSERSRQNQGRGRGGRGRSQRRGAPRSAPYSRPPREKHRLTPRATPDDQLVGATTSERAIARARDDLRLAKEWSQWFKTGFENHELSLSSPRNCHLIPNADAFKPQIDTILQEATTSIKGTIEEHCQQLIAEAEHKIQNPPLSLEQQIFKLMQDQQKMLAAQKEMLNNYTKDNFESTLSAVSVIMKETLKQGPDSEQADNTTPNDH